MEQCFKCEGSKPNVVVPQKGGDRLFHEECLHG